MSAVTHVACDAAAAAERPPAPCAHPGWVLATTMLASSLAFIDGSVVNVSLPAIARDLHAGAADLQWVLNGYLLPLSALLLLGGAAGDRYGRRRLLILGTGLFALASAGCALAPSLDALLIARGLQGLGAAMLMPNSLAILGAAFSGEARGRAIGAWAAAGAAFGAVGPVLGGWLIDTVGWRAIFLINLPVAAGAIALAAAFVRDPPNQAAPALDGWGAAIATLALGALAWGLTVGAGPGGWTLPAGAAVLAGALASVAYVWVERRRGDAAMTPLVMFASRSFVGLTLLTLLLYGALAAVVVLIPFVLMQAGGYSATEAGAALLPFPLIMALASPFTGALAGRVGSRKPLAIGALLVALAFALAMRIGGRGDYWTLVLPAVLVLALGMALAAAPLTNAVLAAVDDRHRGSASGFNSAAARAGGLIATALLGPVLATSGVGLIAAFRLAALVGAIAAALAAIAAWMLVDEAA